MKDYLETMFLDLYNDTYLFLLNFIGWVGLGIIEVGGFIDSCTGSVMGISNGNCALHSVNTNSPMRYE